MLNSYLNLRKVATLIRSSTKTPTSPTNSRTTIAIFSALCCYLRLYNISAYSNHLPSLSSFHSLNSPRGISQLSRQQHYSSYSTTYYKRHHRTMSLSTSPTTKEIVLDRDSFKQNIDLLALRIPAKQCSNYLNKFKDFLFERPRFKRIYESPDGNSAYRLLLLTESIKTEEELVQRLPKDLIDFHNQQLNDAREANDERPVEEGGKIEEHQGLQSVHIHQITLGYEHFGADEVLNRLLGGLVEEVPTAFEQAGHIAHMNLRDEALPYKKIVGQVIIDKNPSIKTVVNKIGNIETEFRTFPLEVIAGKEDFEVTLKESGAIFHFNFAQVYWNSRLQMEHSRIIQIIRDSAILPDTTSSDEKSKPWIIADIMGGVGPFAIPLAMTNIPSAMNNPHFDKNMKNEKKKGNHSNTGSSSTTVSAGSSSTRRVIQVHSNDLNPASYKYLVENCKTNHCGKYLTPYNLDGRKFVIDIVENHGILFHEAIMNLPQNATDFLDVFIGLYHRYKKHPKHEQIPFFVPRIHVYAFTTFLEDPIGDIINRSAGIMRCTSEDIRNSGYCEGHVVRDVSPKKVMVCLSFKVPMIVANAEPLNEFPAFGASSCKKRGADEMAKSDDEA